MSSEKFDLRWNDFPTNAVSTIRNLVTDNEYTDVTLVSDDRRKIKAHKVILASASQFFREILPEISSHNPVLFLKGIEHSELLAIMKFIYVGTTEVAQDNLEKFMKAAQDLQIEGLQENKNDKDNLENIDDYHEDIKYNVLASNNFGVETGYQQNNYGAVLLQETTDQNTLTGELSNYFDESQHQRSDLNNLKKYKTGGNEDIRFKCDQCHREFSRKDNLQSHKESKHEGKKYSCGECGLQFAYQRNLSQHKTKLHR